MMESSFNKRLCKRAVVACSIFATVVTFHSLAYGHARLIRSQPAANARLKEVPKLVELWFSEDLEPTMSTIAVTDQSGKRVDKNNAAAAEGNKKLQIDLEDLGSGAYTVEWKALATDQHTMKGKFIFNVAIAEKASNTSTPAQTPNEANAQTLLPSAQVAESTEESGSSWMMSFVRWLQYLAMMSLVGGFALRLLVLGPALRANGGPATVAEKSNALAAGQRRILLLSWASVVLLLSSTFIELVQQAAAVFDKTIGESLSPSVLSEVLTKTGYGGAWFLQVGTACALVIILLLLGLGLKRSPAKEHTALWWTALLIGIVLLVAPSWTGHAAAALKDFRLAVVIDWLHLVAGAFWVGGLFHLALITRPVLQELDRTNRAGALHRIVKLFTRVAIPTVVVLVFAGLYNTWVHVDSFGELWSTVYGRTLLLKLLLVVLMLVFGGVNNFHFGKKAARLSGSQAGEDVAREHNKLESGFSRSVRWEAALGVAVLLVTAILAFQTPARSHPVMTSNQAESTLVQKRK